MNHSCANYEKTYGIKVLGDEASNRKMRMVTLLWITECIFILGEKEARRIVT